MKRLTILQLFCMALTHCCFISLRAQDDITTIIIDGSTRLTPYGIVDIKLNDFTTQATVTNEGKAEVIVPKLLKGIIRIEVSHKKPYQNTANTWSSSFNLNGSGYVIYILAADGKGIANQWPAVTWKVSKGILDLFLNGSSKGTTQLTRGVEPERRHRFTWKRNNVVICDTMISLPFNVKRTCICDEQKKAVTIH